MANYFSITVRLRKYCVGRNFFGMALSVVALAMAFYGCNKDDSSSKAKVVKIMRTSCGEHFSGSKAKSLDGDERYDVRWDNGHVKVTHVNWAVPCDIHDVTVDVKVEGNVVTVNECGDGGLANCICKIDNRCHIMNLPKGTYTFVFKICNEENHRQQCTL